MKTTIELPDDLLIAAKKRAAETRSTLREILERALRRELHGPRRNRSRSRGRIRWVTHDGGLAPDLDLSSREKMYEWFERHRK